MDRRTFLLTLASLPVLRVSAAAEVEFASVLPGHKLVFPLDHGAHPDFRIEWWYTTGWLSLPDGLPLGFQSTFFRVRTGIGENNPSAFAPRQLIIAHAAIADPQLGRLRHDQRAARVGFGRAGFAAEQTNVWVGDWLFDQNGERYQADVRGQNFAYSLSLVADQPPLLNGVFGFSTKAPDPRHASYYYSRPQLKVNGSVTLDGRQQPVSGRAWLDHEWSSELLPKAAQGWDWIGVNFDDGGALMAFRLRHQDGTPLWSTATFRRAGAGAQVLKPDDVAFEALRQWRSSRTGIIYPVEWRVRIGLQIFHLQALIDDQELDSRHTTGSVYWEGAVVVSENRREIGRGYLEMTGYGSRITIG
jgi:predicted secreted hydrolase